MRRTSKDWSRMNRIGYAVVAAWWFRTLAILYLVGVCLRILGV